MGRKYQITAEQKAELEAAREANKDKKVEKRIKALLLRSAGKTNVEIGEICEYHPARVSQLVSMYFNHGIGAIIENHYKGNHRNLSFAEEAAFLEPYRKQAEEGQIIEVSAIKAAYEAKVGHPVGGSQIYYVLHRHGWRKVMPRSRHPKKASDETIEVSKKLTIKSEK